MLQFPLYISLIAGTSSFAQGYLDFGYIDLARWILFFGAFWIFAQINRWRWFAPIGLFAALIGAGFGIWIGLSISWMFAGAVGALFAWDLAEFKYRLGLSTPEGAAAVIQRHLIRLALISGLGLVYSLLRMFYWWEIYTEGLAYLSMLAAAGASLLFGRKKLENR